jgi:membrane protein
MIEAARNWIERLVWGDLLQKYGLPGRIITIVLRNAYAVLRDVFTGQLTLRAMSLVYTTLLSVVPLIAVSFSALKGFGYHKDFEQYMYTFLEPLGDEGVEYTDTVMTLVDNVNGGVLGGVGLAFFIFTAITMVQKTEEAFNYVWYVSKPRNFARRFTEYLLVLSIGPLAMAITMGAIASISNESAFQWLADSALLGPLIATSTKLTPYLLITVVFGFLYWYMPNTRVDLKSALVGGVAGGAMWATLGMIFAAFVVNSVRTQSVYAGFAVALTALIWLYLNWLILLIGSQIAFYFQNPAYLRIGRREPRLSNAMRERVALNIMYRVGAEFREPKNGVRLADIGKAMRIPTITLAPIAAGLEDSGILASNEAEQLLPGRDMSRIRLEDILDVVRVDGETGSHRKPRWDKTIDALGSSLDIAVNDALKERSLLALLEESGK